MSIHVKLTELERKISQLGESYNRLKTENARLSTESTVLKSRISEQQEMIKQLEDKNVNLHIARNPGRDTDENERLKKKIDQYIKEIDKCIELLNS